MVENTTPHSINIRAGRHGQPPLEPQLPKPKGPGIKERTDMLAQRLRDRGERLLLSRTGKDRWTYESTGNPVSAALVKRLQKDGRLVAVDGGGLFEGNPGQVWGVKP